MRRFIVAILVAAAAIYPARRMLYWRRLQQLQTSLLLFKDFQHLSLRLSRIV